MHIPTHASSSATSNVMIWREPRALGALVVLARGGVATSIAATGGSGSDRRA